MNSIVEIENCLNNAFNHKNGNFSVSNKRPEEAGAQTAENLRNNQSKCEPWEYEAVVEQANVTIHVPLKIFFLPLY